MALSTYFLSVMHYNSTDSRYGVGFGKNQHRCAMGTWQIQQCIPKYPNKGAKYPEIRNNTYDRYFKSAVMLEISINFIVCK